jgi:hypothetical protein
MELAEELKGQGIVELIMAWHHSRFNVLGSFRIQSGREDAMENFALRITQI